MVAGIVVYHMDLIWSNRGTSVEEAANSVVSDSGLILSPKNAPEITAPAAMATGIPRPSDMPHSTTPMVLMEPQLVPAQTAIKAGRMKHTGKNSLGVMIFIP